MLPASSTPISDSRPPFFELGCASWTSARFLRVKVRAHKWLLIMKHVAAASEIRNGSESKAWLRETKACLQYLYRLVSVETRWEQHFGKNV